MINHTRRILVIDDDADLLTCIQLVLSAEGFAVQTAQSLAGTDQIRAAPLPDVVVCEVRMAGQPAFAALDQLRAEPDTRDLPVLLCTGAVQDIEQAGERLPGERTRLLLKPFAVDDLLACIDLLSRPQSALRTSAGSRRRS